MALTDCVTAGLEAQPKRAIAYQWYTAYSTHDAGNTDKVDETWDRIVPEFGYVAVDHRWAEEQGALKTMDLPSDPTKGIYVLEAYHTMHCLVSTSSCPSAVCSKL